MPIGNRVNPLSFLAVFSTLPSTYVGQQVNHANLKSRQVNPIRRIRRSVIHQGDAKAFEFIHRSYREFVHRICLRSYGIRIEAEDAAQSIVWRICKINTFEANQRFIVALPLATNIVLMRFRRNKHRWIP